MGLLFELISFIKLCKIYDINGEDTRLEVESTSFIYSCKIYDIHGEATTCSRVNKLHFVI